MQSASVVLEPKTYTRADYTALRAWALKIPVSKIGELYYGSDCPQINCVGGLERYLNEMREDLIIRSIDSNPHAADLLRKARQGGMLTNKALEVIFQTAQAKVSLPQKSDPVSMWLRPKLCASFRLVGIITLESLIAYIDPRGSSWWRSIPRIGAIRAEKINRFLIANENSLGVRMQSILTERPTADLAWPHQAHHSVLLEQGQNRNTHFCLIAAKNDIDAIQSFLIGYQGGSRYTYGTYAKEIRRFLIWCSERARKPLSDVMVGDVEAYKEILANPPAEWVGRRVSAKSLRWKPFYGDLSPASQKASFMAIKHLFAWLVKVRYLIANPYDAVRPPSIDSKPKAFTDKALPFELWTKLLHFLDLSCNTGGSTSEAKQLRIGRAAILLMGDSGLRRAEAAGATRSNLQATDRGWLLSCCGKGNRWREVPISKKAVEALTAHWVDRGSRLNQSCSSPAPDAPLISPISVIGNSTAFAKHGSPNQPYTPNNLARLVTQVTQRVIKKYSQEFTSYEKEILNRITAHSFRHTFGTHAAASSVPIDVIQSAMGHSNLRTTSIYIRAEQNRVQEEIARFHQQHH